MPSATRSGLTRPSSVGPQPLNHVIWALARERAPLATAALTAPTVTISGNTYYNTYVFGDDAIFSVFLGRNPNDGSKNYKLFIQTAPDQGSVSDPARQIGGY